MYFLFYLDQRLKILKKMTMEKCRVRDFSEWDINEDATCLPCSLNLYFNRVFKMPKLFYSFDHFLENTKDSVKAAQKGLVSCTYDKDRAYRLTLFGRVFQRQPMYNKFGRRGKDDRKKIFEGLKIALESDKDKTGLLEYGYYNHKKKRNGVALF